MRIEVLGGEEGWPLAEPLDREVYPEDVMAHVVWRNVVWAHADRRVLVLDGVDVVCHAGVYFREATHDGTPVRVAGIGGVMTSPRARQRGCASDAMRTALSLMLERGDDFGLLFCEPHNISFYTRLGWRLFAGEVFCQQPLGRIRFDIMGAMILPVRKTVENGVIDLQGLPW